MFVCIQLKYLIICLVGHLQIGFNAGQGREFHPLPYSNTESVVYLDEMASHQGRYVYEVSGEVIRRGECLRLDTRTGKLFK